VNRARATSSLARLPDNRYPPHRREVFSRKPRHIAAIVLKETRRGKRDATGDEKAVLARYAGWAHCRAFSTGIPPRNGSRLPKSLRIC